MASLGNFIWFFFCGGLGMALAWLGLGTIMCCTIIGIPFGKAAFRIAGFAALPFGKELVPCEMLGQRRMPGTMLANIIWFCPVGALLAIGHLVSAIVCVCLIPLFWWLGAPAWALANINLAKVSFAPLGKVAVRKDEAAALRAAAITAKAAARINEFPGSCHICGCNVEASKGILWRENEHWIVYCQTHKKNAK